MRLPLHTALILLIVNAAVDLYLYAAAHSYCRRRIIPAIIGWSSPALALALVACTLMAAFKTAVPVAMWMLVSYMSVYAAKYCYVIFDVLSRLPALWRRKRWRWMSHIGLAAGIALFLLLWHGVLIARYRLHVSRIDAPIENLPEQFDGLTIAQISDIHLGTFGSDTAFVSTLVDSVNALSPDLIVFTGDLVNQRSAELAPHMAPLSRLHAPMGVYSIMGNHDYGKYSSWPSEADRLADVATLQQMQRQMGWTVLLDSTAMLTRGNDSIALIGVQYIGESLMSDYGSLSKAYPDISDPTVKILLSHDPDHWYHYLRNKPHANIALTLSGHTHAMQMRLFGLSPAAWKYHAWAGLYTDRLGRMLYVNIGEGEVGIPARIGSANPEITVFTLSPSQSQ